METHWIQALGGLGLFLFGMSVMTDGLRGLAGRLLHQVLARFTHSPASGVLTGTLSTAILQSSSATTVAAVGFVSAGLLSFDQALGIIFGANLGTTVTGWLVALLGLKLNIGQITLPLILAGALMRLFGRGRLRSGGTALAGFGLIFLGISLLQAGMAGWEGRITPDTFPGDTLWGRLQLVLIGIAVTIVTQSSSAGVATALTAVYTGTIGFSQAAALVIGMDVGTTVTAALATIGGSRETRRTGYSHVVYNVLTAIGAFFLLPVYVRVLEGLDPDLLGQQAELALVGFHSLFNLLGVLVILPLVPAFARLMYRLVPEEPGSPELVLDRRLLSEPSVALDTSLRLVRDQVIQAVSLVDRLLNDPENVAQDDLSVLRQRLLRVRAYVDDIHLSPDQERDWERLNALIHLLDHLRRLLTRCEEEPERIRTLLREEALAPIADGLAAHVGQLLEALQAHRWQEAADLARHYAEAVDGQAEMARSLVSSRIASGELDMEAGNLQLEAIRWARRVSWHLARLLHHLARIGV